VRHISVVKFMQDNVNGDRTDRRLDKSNRDMEDNTRSLRLYNTVHREDMVSSIASFDISE